MCGIAGVIRWSGLTEMDQLSGMKFTNLLRQRGPDGEGIYRDPFSIHVQTLLSFQGNPGKLPLETARYLITYNGEIYNSKELRRELSSHDFITETDTETLLAAWMHWGEAAILKLEGMFAFFIWDKIERRGIAARDPLGVKPFFYTRSENFFSYSSQASDFVRTGILPFRPSQEYIDLYLTAPYFSGARSTPFTGVETLLPGEILEISDKDFRKRSYVSSIPAGPFREEKLRDALLLSVDQCFCSREKIGLFLSGGLDSTLIAAMAQKQKPLAYTIHYPENETLGHEDSLIVNSSDLPYARLAAELFQTPLKEIHIPLTSYGVHLERTLETNDLICAWEQEVSQNILSREATIQVKGIVVGDAADELNFGYPFFNRDEIRNDSRKIIEFFGTVPLKKTKPFEITEVLSQSAPTVDDLVKRLWLPRLLHNGDTHTMAHSIEARVPFAHSAVISAVSSLTLKTANAAGIEKSHLRRLSERYLPRDLAWRKKSALTKSFAGRSVIHEKFKKHLRESSFLLEDFLDLDRITPWVHRSKLTDQDTGLEFRVLALSTWLRRFL